MRFFPPVFYWKFIRHFPLKRFFFHLMAKQSPWFPPHPPARVFGLLGDFGATPGYEELLFNSTFIGLSPLPS